MNADLGKYNGEYVIISNGKVVLHGSDAAKLLDEFRKKNPNVVPKIAKIPSEETLVL